MKLRKRSLRIGVVLGAGVAGLCVLSTTQAATTWYVSTNGKDANTGTSWASAKQTAQAAVNAATNGDTVVVSNGVYLLTSSIRITNAIDLTSLNGSGVTILDGQQAGRCVTVDGAAATVKGFTLRNGRAVVGGGVYCNEGTIESCVMTNNQAVGTDANDGMGGGVYVAYGTLSNCVMVSNAARSTNAYQSAWGGGVYCYGSSVKACLVSNNLCTADSANGGGVVLYGGQLRNSLVVGNAGIGLSYASGGGVYADIMQLSVTSLIEACMITNNRVSTTDTWVYTSAAAAGGGLYIGNGTTVRSTVVSGNTSQSLYGFTSGGGVWTSGSILENCTVAYNSSTTQNGHLGAAGGVMWGYNDQCYNNIIRLNSADSGSDNWEVNSFSYPLFVNSDIGPFVPATNTLRCISVDPLFVNAGGGNFRLQSGSPCVNAGTNLPSLVGTLDLDGNSRLSGSSVDLGAYEYGAANNLPALSSPTRSSGSQFRFLVNSTAGQTYTVQYSTTLTNWIPLLVTNASTSSFGITDPNATNSLRLYRVIVGP